MSEVFNLDSLDNGAPGAADRMAAGLAAADLPFHRLGTYFETERAQIQGTLSAVGEQRVLIERPAEWVEGCLLLPETNLSGRHGLPYLPARDLFLLGDGLNKHPDHYGFGARPSDADAAPERPSDLPGIRRGARPIERYRALTPPDPSGATRLDAAFVIGGRGAATYGHWLLDFVPQILTALDTGRALGLDVPIVVINITPFARRLLRFLGLEDRCYFTQRDEMVQVERLYFPLITKLRSRYCLTTLRRGYGHLLDLSYQPKGQPKRPGTAKILVARRKPPYCRNFDALRAALEPQGFEVLYPEDYHYRKQYRLFERAAVVVGEDGSALHNAGFCRPGTPLVVFSRGDKVNYWHAPVSQAAGLPLTYLQSQCEGDSYDAPIADILQAL